LTADVWQPLTDIKTRIGYIRLLLADKSLADLEGDFIAIAALERFFEIISEASRRLPEALRAAHPEVPWRQVADIGNRLRHAYESIEPRRLWAICERDLDPLEAAIDTMLAANQD
jgi:uncharacterized protein with HEPN domain